MSAPTLAPVTVDTAAAAVAAGVEPCTIRAWISRGYLAKVGVDEHGRSLVDLAAVYRCAAARRRVSYSDR